MRMTVLSAALLIALTGAAQVSARDGEIKQEEVEYQTKVFKNWWDAELAWRFDDLPTKGQVQSYRIPYSGHDYPDKGGGTINVLAKYDRAFNRRPLAMEWERDDVTAHGEHVVDDGQGPRPFGGFFRRLAARRRGPPGWYGHCNGWTAAAIRHAEPESNVVRNGVVFTPADIKGLLAEIYMYSDSEFLGGVEPVINPALLHVVITNWLGRGEHPVAMETAVGEEVWNYPIYAYATTHGKSSDGKKVEVKMNVAYAQSTTSEFDRSPRIKKVMYFHYMLDLDDEGKIVGGRYFGDSNRIDMLWAPLKPVQGGEEGNEHGNPYVNVKEVLAMWRESVSEDLRNKWWNIDPTEEDRIIDAEDEQVANADTGADGSDEGQGEDAPAAEEAEVTSQEAPTGDDANPVANEPDDAAEAPSAESVTTNEADDEG